MAKKSAPSTSGFKSYALSDQGVRLNNEDLVHNDDERGIYFVVDGMGGHAAGEQAARIACERLRGRLERATGSPQQRIREAITLANNAIFEAAEKHADWNGMACVLTVALVSGQAVTIGHVGDSRLYKLRASSADKITRDHSPVGELEDGQHLSEAEAMAHPRRNEVYRDVGSTPHDPDDKDFIDIYEIAAEPDSALLLCSDGLTDAVPLADIRRIIRENGKDQKAAVRLLIEEAKKQNAKDNISVVLVQGAFFGRSRAMPTPIREVEAPTGSTGIRMEARGETPVETRRPLWQRLLLPVVWMAVGAGLYFGAQEVLDLRREASPKTATATDRKPVTLTVNARVPGARLSIAAALAQAVEGDTIELAPGIYDEPVHIEKSNILIEGSGALLRPKPTAEGVDGITITKAAGVRIQNLRIAGDSDGDLLTGIHLVDSQVSLRNVNVTGAAGPGIDAAGTSTLKMDGSSVRDCSGPGLLLRGAVAATVRFTAIVGNGRDAGDKQPGILQESTVAPVLVGNTFANNGGPAITQQELPTQEVLTQNLFSLEGRKGRLEDIRVTRKRAHP